MELKKIKIAVVVIGATGIYKKKLKMESELIDANINTHTPIRCSKTRCVCLEESCSQEL